MTDIERKLAEQMARVEMARIALKVECERLQKLVAAANKAVRQ